MYVNKYYVMTLQNENNDNSNLMSLKISMNLFSLQG